MKITFDQLDKIIIAIRSINSNDKNGQPVNDRLTWAIQRFQEKNESVIKKMSAEELDLNREYASVDDQTKIFISGPDKGLQYTKENLKKCADAIAKFKTTTFCEIEPYVCKNDLTRSSLLPLWIQRELDGVILVMDAKIKEFMKEETDGSSVGHTTISNDVVEQEVEQK